MIPCDDSESGLTQGVSRTGATPNSHDKSSNNSLLKELEKSRGIIQEAIGEIGNIEIRVEARNNIYNNVQDTFTTIESCKNDIEKIINEGERKVASPDDTKVGILTLLREVKTALRELKIEGDIVASSCSEAVTEVERKLYKIKAAIITLIQASSETSAKSSVVRPEKSSNPNNLVPIEGNQGNIFREAVNAAIRLEELLDLSEKKKLYDLKESVTSLDDLKFLLGILETAKSEVISALNQNFLGEQRSNFNLLAIFRAISSNNFDRKEKEHLIGALLYLILHKLQGIRQVRNLVKACLNDDYTFREDADEAE